MFTPKHFSNRYYKKLYTVYQTALGATGTLPYVTKKTDSFEKLSFRAKENCFDLQGKWCNLNKLLLRRLYIYPDNKETLFCYKA